MKPGEFEARPHNFTIGPRDPAARYATVGEFYQDLRRHLAGAQSAPSAAAQA